MPRRIILDLCGGSGSWSRPYAEAGYDVRLITLPAHDVRLQEWLPLVWGILAAPPCTVFASSGARWPRTPEQIRDALSVVDACLRLIHCCRPAWWALENPVGTLRRYLGPPDLIIQPFHYGDPYTKRTCLWGRFTVPRKTRVPPTTTSPIHHMPPGPDRAAKRAITPSGFARAFFAANP